MNEFGSLKENLVADFEALIESSLPPSYFEFLKQNNGGKVDNGSFKLSIKDQDVSRVDLFYGLHEGPDYSRLDDCYGVFIDRITKRFIPIACDPFGNQICLLLKEPQRGSIWFWDHELTTSDESLAFTKLADDILQFYQCLNKSLGPEPGQIESILENNDIEQLRTLIDKQIDLNALDEHGRTILESAVIKNKPDIVKLLHEKGAELRNAQKLSEKNCKYFPEHKPMLDLIMKLSAGIRGH